MQRLAIQRGGEGSPYTGLPAELRRVLEQTYLKWKDMYSREQDVWHGLSEDRRTILVAIFGRMQAAGLWTYVHRIESVKCRAGDGVHFTTLDRKALLDELHKGRRFCRDPSIGAALHPGQTSYRQLVSGAGLHLSIGVGQTFDVHLDSVAPVALGPGLTCSYDFNASLAHWGRDVIGLETGIELLPDQGSLVHHPDPSQKERNPEAEFARLKLLEW